MNQDILHSSAGLYKLELLDLNNSITEAAWRPLLPKVTPGVLEDDRMTNIVNLLGCYEPLVAFLLLVAMPGAPSSVLAPSSKARSP